MTADAVVGWVISGMCYLMATAFIIGIWFDPPPRWWKHWRKRRDKVKRLQEQNTRLANELAKANYTITTQRHEINQFQEMVWRYQGRELQDHARRFEQLIKMGYVSPEPFPKPPPDRGWLTPDVTRVRMKTCGDISLEASLPHADGNPTAVGEDKETL